MNRLIPAAVVLALAAGAAQAADPAHVFALEEFAFAPPPPPDAGPGTGQAWHEWAEEFSREMHASMGTMFSGRVGSSRIVKGAPYSAQIVTETKQTLADGNVITRKSEGAVYRDGEGRTRQETATRDGKPRNVYINDPVEGKRYIVIPGAKHPIALPDYSHMPRVRSGNTQVVNVDDKEIRIENGKVTVDGKEVAGSKYELKTAKGKNVHIENGHVFVDGRDVTVHDVDRDGGSRVGVSTMTGPDGVTREEVRVQVVRTGDDVPMPPIPPTPPVPPLPPGEFTAPIAPLPPMPGMNELRFESSSRLGKGVTTSLGLKDMEGVKAEGTQTVWTIPAGQIGNRDPIHVVAENWYSPDLLVTVYSRYSDPRTGESTYRLASIKRGEPDAALFKKPPENATDVVRERTDHDRPDRKR